MKGRSKKGFWIFMCGAIILFVSGLVVLLLPVINNWLYERDVRQMKQNFEEQIKEATAESSLPFEKLYQELKHRNEKLYIEKQKDLKDPFSYEQPAINLTEYGLDGNVIGFVSIPKMDVELPILLGANNANMRDGAVHLTETSYPIGGENTNCVLAAHRDASWATMFRNIEKLKTGDKIYIKNFRETLTYQVVDARVISPTDVKDLLIQDGKDMVTLITCHPYGYNYQRYVAYCERVQN